MPNLGEVNFDWTTPCYEAEFLRWKGNAEINFDGNNNTKSPVKLLSYTIG